MRCSLFVFFFDVQCLNVLSCDVSRKEAFQKLQIDDKPSGVHCVEAGGTASPDKGGTCYMHSNALAKAHALEQQPQIPQQALAPEQQPAPEAAAVDKFAESSAHQLASNCPPQAPEHQEVELQADACPHPMHQQPMMAPEHQSAMDEVLQAPEPLALVDASEAEGPPQAEHQGLEMHASGHEVAMAEHAMTMAEHNAPQPAPLDTHAEVPQPLPLQQEIGMAAQAPAVGQEGAPLEAQDPAANPEHQPQPPAKQAQQASTGTLRDSHHDNIRAFMAKWRMYENAVVPSAEQQVPRPQGFEQGGFVDPQVQCPGKPRGRPKAAAVRERDAGSEAESDVGAQPKRKPRKKCTDRERAAALERNEDASDEDPEAQSSRPSASASGQRSMSQKRQLQGEHGDGQEPGQKHRRVQRAKRARAEPAHQLAAEPEHQLVAEPEQHLLPEPEHQLVANPAHQMVAEPEHQLVAEPAHELVAGPEHQLVAEPEQQLVAEPEHQPVAEAPHQPIVGQRDPNPQEQAEQVVGQVVAELPMEAPAGQPASAGPVREPMQAVPKRAPRQRRVQPDQQPVPEARPKRAPRARRQGPVPGPPQDEAAPQGHQPLELGAALAVAEQGQAANAGPEAGGVAAGGPGDIARQLDAARRARQSRKSSAYHQARRQALAEGKTQEEAKAAGKKVPWSLY